MKRSQIREAIKSIVKRKLLENASDQSSQRLAYFIKKKFHEGETINSIVVQTHHGDTPLELVEWWLVGDTLHVGVSADAPPSGLHEEATNMFGGSTSSSTQNTQGTPQNSQNTQQNQNTTQMTDQDTKALEDAQKQQDKLTNDKNRLTGAIKQWEEPLRRKMTDAQRKLAGIEDKLGQTSKKISDIQKKYQKN